MNVAYFKLKNAVFLFCFLLVIFHPAQIKAAQVNVDKNNGSCVNTSGQADPPSVVYCKISDAITDATDGDTITVAAGVYTQNLIINKSLTLQTSSSASIAPSSGIGINFRSPSGTLSNVSISGFTIDAGTYGILMDGNYFAESLAINGLTISNCTISGNSTNGIHVTDSANITNLTISNSTIQNNGWNVLLQESTLTNTTFSNVTFGSNNSGSTLSFASGTFNGVTVENSSFSGNAWEYIDLGVGWIGVSNFSDVLIKNNTFSTGCVNAIWGDSSGVFSANEVILEKNFFPSTSFVHNYTSNNVIATNNWWGSASGPSVSDNSLGVGTTIDDNAFIYDPWCAGPFAPGVPSSPSTPTKNTTPAWSWTVSATCVLGLNTVPYIVEWCQNSNFIGCTNNTGTSTENSFTHSTSLGDGTWYFRVQAKDNLDNQSDYSQTGSIVIDTTGPTFSSISSSPASASATITWSTNENSSTQIKYGLNTNYGNTTPLTNISTKTTSHSNTINGLAPCSTYHYQILSKDDLGNQGSSSDNSFTTTGCVGSAIVTSQNSETIDTVLGGSIDLVSDSKGIGLSIPASSTSSNADFQIKQLDKTSTIETIATPISYSSVGFYIYDLKALTDVGTTVSSFNKPIDITMTYGSSDISGFYESSLKIYRWDGNVWESLTNCSANIANKTVTCETTHFSIFGLFGKTIPDSSGVKNLVPGCSDVTSTTAPDLFEIRVSSKSATLYFAPPPAPYSSFYVAYSRKPNAWEYGTEFNQGYSNGVLKYPINLLSPNTIYYFKIRAGNGCATGNWSPVLTVKTTSSSGQNRTFYKNSKTRLFSVVKKLVISPKKITTPGPTTAITPTKIIPTITTTPSPPSAPKTKKCFLWWCF